MRIVIATGRPVLPDGRNQLPVEARTPPSRERHASSPLPPGRGAEQLGALPR